MKGVASKEVALFLARLWKNNKCQLKKCKKMKKLITILSLGMFSLGFSQSVYYNDYQRSITDVNWQTVAANLLLSNQQKAQLFELNNQ